MLTFSVWGNLRSCVWDSFCAYNNQSYYTSVFLLVLQSEGIVFPTEAVLCAGIVGWCLIPSSLQSPSSVQLVYDTLHGLFIVWGYVPYETHIMAILKRLPLAFQYSQVLHIFRSNFWSEGPRVQRCVGWLMPNPSLMWTIWNGSASFLHSCPGAEPGNKATPAQEPENGAVYGYCGCFWTMKTQEIWE